MDHKKVAQRIADALGDDNIASAAHCATRLRLVLKDEKKINQEALDEDPDLKGTFRANGQYQIIVGPGDVSKVYDALIHQTGAPAVSTEQAKEDAADQKNKNPLMRLVKLLSDIFVPLIPALTAGGLLLALNNLLVSEGLFGAQSIVEMYPAFKDIAAMVNTFAGAAFTFLPVLIAYSATKRFGGNEYLGAVMGMIMVMPALVSGYDVANVMAAGKMPVWDIFGFQIAQAGYQGQVLPVIGVSWILAQVEKFFHKHLSNAVDFTFTPLLTILITGFITFAFVGPVLRTASDALLNGLVWLINFAGPVGYGVFGLFYSAIVLTGLHQSFPAIETTLLADIAKTGGDFIFPIASVANMAQGGATFAMLFLAKSEKEKSLASSAGISAFLGITEPAMFGVNLKHRYPFYIAMCASGIASVILGIFGVASASLGSAGIIGFISMISKHIKIYLIAEAVAALVAFAGTYFYGKYHNRQLAAQEVDAEKEALTKMADHQSQHSTETAPETTNNATVNTDIYAAVEGKTVPLTSVADEVFSSELMGKGIAINPSGKNVYAPCDGEISISYETKHAYGIVSDTGAEILIHIGIDTVEMKGNGFTSKVKQGEQVKKGQLIATFDRDEIEKAGHDATVMMVVTNTNNFADVKAMTDQTVTKDDQVLELIGK
ncbi:MAG: sucrose-specific PTS transporter subunit IIBC [Aerococcus sp.]|nr:sucrose-specific PTS transporter subunit IIBC [Aerococcus sp.]